MVVDPSNLDQVLVAAQLAAALNSPLLFPHPQLTAEIGRLDPTTVHVVGTVDVAVPPDVTLHHHNLDETVEEIKTALGTDRTVKTATQPDAISLVETVRAIEARDRVVTPDQETTGETGIDKGAVIRGLAVANNSPQVWMVDAADHVSLLLASASMRVAGATVVAIDPNDLFRYPEVGEAIEGQPGVRIVGTSAELDDWKLRTLIRGDQLPGGGFEAYPDHFHRRFVAFYGNPRSASMGALGQGTPQEIFRMMHEGGTLTGYPDNARCLPTPCRGVVPNGFLDMYAADGAHVVPTFNYIASVAHPGCRSSLHPLTTFQEGIDFAADNGGYVVFDLQPGGDEFITQAKHYEEALLLPHVTLALDPEWRCGWPNQTEFHRTGTVTAAEINVVIDWLADLVNEHALPQKLLVIQQFRHDMISDRDQIKQRPEVQVVIQMDGEGQGRLSVKEGSWNNLTRGTEDNHWLWGWKQFFVRDSANGPYAPAEVLDRDPVPVYVSYQ